MQSNVICFTDSMWIVVQFCSKLTHLFNLTDVISLSQSLALVLFSSLLTTITAESCVCVCVLLGEHLNETDQAKRTIRQAGCILLAEHQVHRQTNARLRSFGQVNR